MTATTAFAVVATAVAAYQLGASEAVPRAAVRLRYRTRTAVASALGKPARHPARWAAETASYTALCGSLAYSFIRHPRHSTRLMRQMLLVAPRRHPQELKDAVAEAAALHVPGRPVQHLHITIRHPGAHPDLTNVAFRHSRAPQDFTRLTLGGNPDWFGGIKPEQGTREQLEASRDRVKAALRSLPIGPDVHVVVIPIHPREQ